MKSLSGSKFLQRTRFGHIENKGLKLLSLGLAILLFVVSRQPVSDVHLRDVSIEFHGLGPGIEIIRSGEQTESADVLLRGPRNVVRNLMPNQLAVIADLTNKELGERVIPLNVDDSSLPDYTRVVSIEPPSIKIRIEKTARKMVGIEPQFIGQVAQGAEIYRVTLEPKEIEIEGPKSLVDKTSFVSTESVNLSERHDYFSTSVEVETPNSSVRFKTPTTVNLSIEIGERRAIRRFLNVPVQWLDPPSGGRLLTKTVN